MKSSRNRHQNRLKDMLDELQHLDRHLDEARINALIYAIHAINRLELLEKEQKKR